MLSIRHLSGHCSCDARSVEAAVKLVPRSVSRHEEGKRCRIKTVRVTGLASIVSDGIPHTSQTGHNWNKVSGIQRFL